MADIFCGVGKIPKNARRGTMRECAEKKQIRYYGIKKIDAKTLALSKNKTAIPETREELIKMIARLTGLIRRNKTRCEKSKDMKEKDNYCKIWKDSEKKLALVVAKYKKVKAKRDKELEEQKKQNKKKSKSKKKSKKKQ